MAWLLGGMGWVLIFHSGILAEKCINVCPGIHFSKEHIMANQAK